MKFGFSLRSWLSGTPNAQHRSGLTACLLPNRSPEESPQDSPPSSRRSSSIENAEEVASQTNTPPRGDSPRDTVLLGSDSELQTLHPKDCAKEDSISSPPKLDIEELIGSSRLKLETVATAPVETPEYPAPLQPFAMSPLAYLRRGIVNAAAYVNPLAYFKKKPTSTSVVMRDVVVLNEAPEDPEEVRFHQAISTVLDRLNSAARRDYERFFCGCFSEQVRRTAEFRNFMKTLLWSNRILIITPLAGLAGLAVSMIGLRTIQNVNGGPSRTEAEFWGYISFIVTPPVVSLGGEITRFFVSRHSQRASKVFLSVFGGAELVVNTFSAGGGVIGLSNFSDDNLKVARVSIAATAVSLGILKIIGSIIWDLKQERKQMTEVQKQESESSLWRRTRIQHPVFYKFLKVLLKLSSPVIKVVDAAGVYFLYSTYVQALQISRATMQLPTDTTSAQLFGKIFLSTYSGVSILPRYKSLEKLQLSFFWIKRCFEWVIKDLLGAGILINIVAPKNSISDLDDRLITVACFVAAISHTIMYSQFYGSSNGILMSTFYKEKNKSRLFRDTENSKHHQSRLREVLCYPQTTPPELEKQPSTLQHQHLDSPATVSLR